MRRPPRRVSIARWASDAVARSARSIGPSSVSEVGSIGTRMRANAAAVSDQPHERYCASSPAVAIMPFTALEPPTPRPRTNGSANVRPGVAAASKKLELRLATCVVPAPASTTTTSSPASARRAATTHPALPAPTTTQRTCEV